MKKSKDKEFYNHLDIKIQELLTFNQFIYLEKKNQYSCDFYKNLINKIAEITGIETSSNIEKIINLIQVLDLEYEKFGRVIKNCNFVEELKINHKKFLRKE